MALALRSMLRGFGPSSQAASTVAQWNSLALEGNTILSLLPSISLGIPVSIQLGIPSLLSDIWDSVLRAVPKKKTSHMKKRHRQMAGKALKDVTALSKCPGCGNVKRAHILCPYCVADIQAMWKKQSKESNSSTTA